MFLCYMKDMRISVSDEVHSVLLQEQLQRKLKKQPRTTLSEIAADMLEKHLVPKKPDQK